MTMFLPILFHCPSVREGRAVCFIFIKYMLKEELSSFPLNVLVKQNNGNKDFSALQSYSALSWECKASLLLFINFPMNTVGIKEASNLFKSLESVQNQQQQVLQKWILSFAQAAKHNYTAKTWEDSAICFFLKDEKQYVFFSTALRINVLKQVSQLGTLYKSLANLDPHDVPPWGEQHCPSNVSPITTWRKSLKANSELFFSTTN